MAVKGDVFALQHTILVRFTIFCNGISVSKGDDTGNVISFVIVFGIDSFVIPWLKLLGQHMLWV